MQALKLATIALGWALLWSSPLWATVQGHHAAVARLKAGGGGPTYLLEEDCEGSGTPGTWSDGNSPNWDYATSPAPLEGSLSWRSASLSDQSSSPTFTATSPCYIYFRWSSAASMGNVTVIRLMNTGGEIAGFQHRGSTAVRISHGSDTQTSSSGFNSSDHHVWIHYTADPGGGTGTMDCYLSATSTKPGSPTFTGITAGTSTTGIDQVIFDGDTNGVIFDDLKVSASVIGSAP